MSKTTDDPTDLSTPDASAPVMKRYRETQSFTTRGGFMDIKTRVTQMRVIEIADGELVASGLEEVPLSTPLSDWETKE